MSTPLAYQLLRRANCGLAPLVALAFVACEALTASSPALVSTTDAHVYLAEALPLNGALQHYQQYAFRVIVRTANRSTREVALQRCWPSDESPTFTVRLHNTDAESLSAFAPVWMCVGGVEPLIIAPHGERVDTFNLRGPTGFYSTGAADGTLEGEMSLQIGAAETNRFLVTVAR